MEYLERAYDDAKYGHISTNPYIEFTIPTITEPDFSPKGKHILSATVQYIPYHLKNRNWNDQLKKKVIDIQDAATKKVSAICPQFYGGLDPYLLELGGGLGAHAGPGSLVIGIQKMDFE